MHNFDSFIDSLRKKFDSSSLPGLDAQMSMAPATRKEELKRNKQNGNPRDSAVLVLFFPSDEKIKLILMKRPTDRSIHSGQVAFPGGKVEADDHDYIQTALREASEEVNVSPADVTVIGALSKLHIPPSNFDVYPIVGYTSERPNFIGNDEVDKILEIELEQLADPGTKTTRTIQHRLGKLVDVPCYYIQEEVIWGATAMMLGELLTILETETYP